MASAKLFGCAINVEAEEEGGVGSGGSTVTGEISQSGIQPDGEATSFSVCFPPFNQGEIGDFNPYFPFAEWNSDSGSVSMDSGADPHNCFIDFFDRESSEVETVGEFYLSQNQRVSTSGDFNIWGFDEMEEDISLGLGIGSGSGSGSGSGDSGGEGLQFSGIDRDSDNENRESDSVLVEIDTALTGEAMVADEELEWEDLQNAINWVEEAPVQVSLFSVEEEEGEEMSLASRDDDQDAHDLDWQVLLAVDDVADYFEDSEVEIMIDPGVMDYSFYLANIDEYGENHGDYDAIFGQMFDNDAGIMGSPPASKRVVDDLPVVEITSEELSNGNIVCAICKDEVVVEEKVKRLPCRHYYHGECIIPWLGIRNTCPVCRYELPTDDLEYERNRRSQSRGSSSLARDLMSE